ncbi:MAG: MATE family efflux transporter [Candidatus Omnitrophota bacterium]|jgi:putative MATE family efflux protein
MPKLVKDGVFITLIRMAVPMLAGTFAINAYNLTDTWFVSRLGTNSLAAMTFGFPVIMLLSFIIRGIGTGAMAVVARALGGRKQETAARLTTHAISLVLIFAGIIAAVGLVTIKSLFSRLGAGGETLAFTEQYMTIWYLGMPVMAVQIMLGDVIIGAGNTKAMSLLMVGGTIVNFIFDPIMIFGFLGFPRMGIAGAALATVLSQSTVLVATFYVLHKKHRLISFLPYSWRRIFVSWRRILFIGLPNVFSSILTPISTAVVIKLVSGFGNSAIAACGIATRIEMFAFMIPMTVGMSLVPFVAQNYGANRFDRIQAARKGTMSFALIFGFVVGGIFFAAVRPLAGLFSSDQGVIDVLVQYISVTCFGYGFLEVYRYSGFCLTGIHQPVDSAILNGIRVVVFLIPMSFAGAKFFGLKGVFWGRLITDILSGIIGIVWTKKILTNRR